MMNELSRVASGGGVSTLPKGWRRALWVLAILSTLVAVAGIMIAPERSGAGVLLGVIYVLGLALAGLLFVALQNVTGASWSVVFRRVPDAMASTLPIAAVLSLAVLALIPTLYEWSHADVVAADPLLATKAAWLNPTFFVIRTVVCMAVWLLFAFLVVTVPLRRAKANGGSSDVRPVGASAAFLAFFAVTFSVLSFDWIMSLEPHWFSTVYALYNFSGLFLGGLAVVTFFVIVLRRLGPLDGVVRNDHLHDLGKLLLGMSTFWAYIWFCQYMLIWYTNIPEETAHFVARGEGTWGVLFLVNLFANWLIPFVVLLPREAKRSETVLLAMSVLLILGRWLDLYLLIGPPFYDGEPRFGVWEILPVLGALSLFVLAFFHALGRTGSVPRGDPGFEESLRHHQ